MNTTIKVQIKNNFGSEAIYIVSVHKDAVLSLTGKKTLTRKDIHNLKQLGFDFEVVQEKISL